MSSEEANHVETRVEHRSGELIAFITISNEARLNSMNGAAMDAFVAALSPLAATPEMRALVVTGAGEKAFIGGADIREMSALADAEEARRFIVRLHRCCEALRAFPVPTIARINGLTLGAGLEIAASCDVRIAVESAVFGMPEVRLGIPSVIEAVLLPMLVGWGRARQIVLFGENFSAQEAFSWGLVQQLVGCGGLDEAVGQWLDRLHSCSPIAIRLQKQLIRSWEDMPLRGAIEAGIESFATAVQCGAASAAMQNFLDRQKARKDPNQNVAE